MPNRSDREKAGTKAREALSKTRKELLSALGFSIERLDTVTDILQIEGGKNDQTFANLTLIEICRLYASRPLPGRNEGLSKPHFLAMILRDSG